MSRTGGTRGLGHEWFDKVLVGTHIRSWCATNLRNILVPLESRLVGDIDRVVNRIGARAAPDFAVSMAHEEACDNDTDDCTEHETANSGSNDYAGGDAGIPG